MLQVMNVMLTPGSDAIDRSRCQKGVSLEMPYQNYVYLAELSQYVSKADLGLAWYTSWCGDCLAQPSKLDPGLAFLLSNTPLVLSIILPLLQHWASKDRQ